MATTSRRDFLKTAALGAGAAASASVLAGCGGGDTAGAGAPNINLNKTFKWTMATTWPSGMAVIGEGAQNLADWMKEASGGRLEVKVAGAGELVGAMEVHGAVSTGQVQMGHGASYYWAGTVKAANWFTAVPFGMTAQQLNAWIYAGGGQALWNEIYADSGDGVIAMPAGNTGCQMAGWFNREINSPDDLQGLVMRIPGLGGTVLSRAGVSTQTFGGGETYTSLENKLVDAAEWVGPYHDHAMGLHRLATYYYYPGWHEPGSALELQIHKPSWEKLPTDLQGIITAAAARANHSMLAYFESRNNDALLQIKKERGDQVSIRRLPDSVIAKLRTLSAEVIDEITADNPMAKKVHASYTDFHKKIAGWSEISEYAALSLSLGDS